MPYKMIIADDEEIILEGLSKDIDWEELGFEIVGLFNDGEKVIEYLENMPVDVVLTDIRMKYCGGVEIAKYVKDSELPCKVVFISGHKEFELALNAIKYDVKEFIMKPSTTAEVLSVFGSIRKDLDKQASDIEFQRKVENRWKDMHPVLAEKFVNSLIMGALDEKDSISHRMELLYPEVNVEKSPCILVNLEIKMPEANGEEAWKNAIEQLEDVIDSLPQASWGAGYPHVIYKSRETIKLFIIMKEYNESREANITLCEQYVQHFRDSLGEITKLELTIEAECVFQNVFEVVDQQDRIVKMSTRQKDVDLHIQEQKKMILMNLMHGNIHIAQKMMNSILESLSGYDVRFLMNYVADVLSSISELFREKNYQVFQSIQPYIEYCSIMNMTSVSDIISYCNRIFDKMKFEMRSFSQAQKVDLVTQIKKYVRNHIEEDIMLEDVAGEVFVTTRHLSRIFKKQTGETFLQYVTRKKMEKAVELLHDPAYRVYNVAQKLGYKTPRYFSKLFYTYSGYYPNQYRKEILGMNESEINQED